MEMDNFMKNSQLAKGYIIEIHQNSNGLLSPIIEFIDSNGEKHIFTSSYTSNSSKFELYESVNVFYTNDKTKLEAHIFDSNEIFIRKYVFLIFGFMFIVLGLVFGRIFWNRDSMRISFYFSKTFTFKKG